MGGKWSWPPHMSDGDVSCTAPVLQTLFKCPTPAFVFKSAAEPSRLVHCREGAESIVPAMKSCVWTCKSAPNMGCFWHFDFEMCLPQPHALFGCSSHQMAPHPRALAYLLFRPSGTAKHWKNTAFRDFLPFWRTFLFFLLSSSLTLPFTVAASVHKKFDF